MHQFTGLAAESIIKNALMRQTLDNVTAVMIAFQNFEEALKPDSETKLTSQVPPLPLNSAALHNWLDKKHDSEEQQVQLVGSISEHHQQRQSPSPRSRFKSRSDHGSGPSSPVRPSRLSKMHLGVRSNSQTNSVMLLPLYRSRGSTPT